MEWDDVVPLACAAYNFLHNEHSKESPFFLMFGREARIPLNTMLQSKIRHLGNDENILSMQALKTYINWLQAIYKKPGNLKTL